jgi:hypothetical protein
MGCRFKPATTRAGSGWIGWTGWIGLDRLDGLDRVDGLNQAGSGGIGRDRVGGMNPAADMQNRLEAGWERGIPPKTCFNRFRIAAADFNPPGRYPINM